MRESGSKRHSLSASVSFRNIVNVREFSPEVPPALPEHSSSLESAEAEEKEEMGKEGQNRSYAQERGASYEEYMEVEEKEEEEEGEKEEVEEEGEKEEELYDSVDTPHIGRRSYAPSYQEEEKCVHGPAHSR